MTTNTTKINTHPTHTPTPTRRDTTPTISVVTPAYNEAPNLNALITETHDALTNHDYELIIVDDGSTDQTPHILTEKTKRHDHITGLTLTRNMGQSTALAAGINHATGDIIVTMDADLQNNPRDIPRLIDKLRDGYDCVSGNRRNRDDPPSKRLPSTIQTHLAHYIGPEISDYGCTLKAYRADAIKSINLYGEGHRYIPAQLYTNGYTITEIDVDHRPRTNGTTNYGAHRILRGFVDLVWHLVWSRYGERPNHLFGIVGLVIAGIGILLGVGTVAINWIDPGLTLQLLLPHLLLSVGMVVFGILLFIFGVLFEFLAKLYYLHRPHSHYQIKQKH